MKIKLNFWKQSPVQFKTAMNPCFLAILCVLNLGRASEFFKEGAISPIESLTEGPSTPFSPGGDSFELPADSMDLYTCLSSRSHEAAAVAVPTISTSAPKVSNVIFLGTSRWNDIATLDFIENPLVFANSQRLDNLKVSERIQFGLHLLAEEAEAIESHEFLEERQQYLSMLKSDFESKVGIPLKYVVTKFELSETVAESLDRLEIVHFRAEEWTPESADENSWGFVYVDTEEEGKFEEFLRETYDIRDSGVIFV